MEAFCPFTLDKYNYFHKYKAPYGMYIMGRLLSLLPQQTLLH